MPQYADYADYADYATLAVSQSFSNLSASRFVRMILTPGSIGMWYAQHEVSAA